MMLRIARGLAVKARVGLCLVGVAGFRPALAPAQTQQPLVAQIVPALNARTNRVCMRVSEGSNKQARKLLGRPSPQVWEVVDAWWSRLAPLRERLSALRKEGND